MESYNMEIIKSLINCGICHERFNDPRILPCLHTYCYGCIRNMTSNYFECPHNDGAKIPRNRIDELAVNQIVIYMIESTNLAIGLIPCSNCDSTKSDYWCNDCSRIYCTSCCRQVHNMIALNNHQIMSLKEKPIELKPCTIHADEKLKYWCRTCAACICSDCLLNAHKHHAYVIIILEADGLQKQVHADLSNIEARLNHNINLTDVSIFEMADQHKNILDMINTITATLKHIIDEHQKELTEKIENTDRYNNELMENFKFRLQNELDQLRSQQSKLQILHSSKNPLKMIEARQEFLDYTSRLNRMLERLNLPAIRIYRVEGADRIPDAREKILQCGMFVEGFRQADQNTAYNNPHLTEQIIDNREKPEWIFKEKYLADKDIKMIADSLKENNVVVKLDLSQHEINNPGVQYLADALRQNRTLNFLYLYKNEINDYGMQYLSDALQDNTALTTLDLSQNIITDQGIEHLANMLKRNHTLTTLHLSQNQISDLGALYLSDALKENNQLQILHLSQNLIGNKGAKHLAQALMHNTALTKLNLYWNHIGDIGAQSFAQTLETNRTLRILFLSRNRIGNEGAKQFIDVLVTNRTLSTTISLHENRIDQKTQRQMKDILKQYAVQVTVNW